MTVKTLWQAQRVSGLKVKPHTHNFYELVYYKSGEGETEVGGTIYRFGAGNFVTIPPDTLHSERHGAKGEVICLGFLSEENTDGVFHVDSSGEICRLLDYMLEEISVQEYGYREIVSAKLTELFITLRRHERQGVSGGKSFKYIINYLKENYHEKIRLSDCAESLSISNDYFRHKFKELTGMSPRDFLINERLKASKRALEEGHSCTETAYMCGFSTSAQFSMLFGRKFGITPKEYARLRAEKIN